MPDTAMVLPYWPLSQASHATAPEVTHCEAPPSVWLPSAHSMQEACPAVGW